MRKRSYLAAVLVLALVFILAALPVYAETPKVEGKFLDSFDREKLAVDGTNNLLADDTNIYWSQSGAGTFSISDGALNAKMDDGGYYRFATNNTDSFKYVIIRIKGDSSAVNDKIYVRLGPAEKGDIDDNAARGDKSLSQLVGSDGATLPAVSSDWQDMVIDVAASGFKLGDGSNGFQIGSWQPMNLDIDYIFMTNTVPGAAAVEEPAATATDTAAATAPEATPNPKTADNTPITAAAVVLVLSAAMLIVIARKKVHN